ncbi:MAG: hypothetical protein ACYC2H_07555 [Thermoplasmatota archaeon]
MAKGPTLRRSRFDADERGSLMVLEAILVALLVLTAILFFTSVQRPSTGSDQGGLDLGQVAADTLAVLRARTMTVGGQSQTLEGWVWNATRGDSATTTALQTFLGEILPTGARYAIRLDNGVSNLTILVSPDSVALPRGARAAQILVYPNWAHHRNDTVTMTVAPGEVLPSTNPLLNGDYDCYIAPNSYSTAPDGPDAGSAADAWADRWTATPGTSVPWKASAAVLGTNQQQVPLDLPYGRWRVYEDSSCSVDLEQVVNVVPPGYRVVTGSVAAGTVTLTDGAFEAGDVGKTLTGVTGAGSGAARIRTVSTSTSAILSVATSTAPANTALTIADDSTFLPYSLQLVVWFGA